MKKIDIKKLTVIAMLCALAYISVLLFIPFPKIGGFLSIEIKDAILSIVGFLYGPIPVVLSAIVVALLELVTVSETGLIGLLMNVLSSAFFLLPAAYVYKKDRSLKGAVVGLVLGIVCTTGAMVLWNWIVTPWYQKIPREAVVDLLVPLILPFNALKSSVNAALSVMLYKSAVIALRKAKLLPETAQTGQKRSRALLIPVGILLITLVLILLVWSGVI